MKGNAYKPVKAVGSPSLQVLKIRTSEAFEGLKAVWQYMLEWSKCERGHLLCKTCPRYWKKTDVF